MLGQLKARIRAEVFSALDDQREPRPPLSHENLLINELIREYLEFNKYKHTASVLTAGGSADTSHATVQQSVDALTLRPYINRLSICSTTCNKVVENNYILNILLTSIIAPYSLTHLRLLQPGFI